MANRLDGPYIDASRKYLISWALISEEFSPGYIMPVAHLHRADGLSFSELFFAMIQVLFCFLYASKNYAWVCVCVCVPW